MRGLQTNDYTSGRTYLTMSAGKFVKRVKEPTQASVERVLEKGENKGKVVHEEVFDMFCGRFIGFDVENSDYGKFWNFIFDITESDGPEETICLKLNYSSGYSNNILTRIPNLNLNEDVRVSGYKFTPKEGGKERIGISLFQFDKDGKPFKIEPYFTKEKPNGCPEMKKIIVKGNDVWDDTDRLLFLERVITNAFGGTKAENLRTTPVDEVSEDLPF